MGKFTLLIFVLFLLALGYFAVLNQEPVTISLTSKRLYEMPKIALILVSTAVGAALMLLYFFIRDTKRFIDNRQFQRKQKKDIRVQDLYSKALNAILAHNVDEARSALENIIEEEPQHMDALLRLGDIASDEEDFQKALNFYKKAHEVNPKNIEVIFSLERTMEATNRDSDALAYLESILELDPDNLAALYRKRAIFEKNDKWDDLTYLQKAIIKCQHNEKDRQMEQAMQLGYKYEQGRYSLENSDLDKAEKAFHTVLRLDKNFIPGYLGLAEVTLREGKLEDAVEFLEKGFDQTSSMIILARLEDMVISLGDPARLIGLYRNSISKEPQNQDFRFFLGKLFYRLEMLDDAFDAFTSIDAGVAPFPELNQLLGNIYLRRQQYDKAAEEFRKAIGARHQEKISYRCADCGTLVQEWKGRCPSCKTWNTFEFNLYGSC